MSNPTKFVEDTLRKRIRRRSGLAFYVPIRRVYRYCPDLLGPWTKNPLSDRRFKFNGVQWVVYHLVYRWAHKIYFNVYKAPAWLKPTLFRVKDWHRYFTSGNVCPVCGSDSFLDDAENENYTEIISTSRHSTMDGIYIHWEVWVTCSKCNHISYHEDST